MTYFHRRDWNARNPRSSTPLTPSQVQGVGFHWPAMSRPLDNVADVKAALRSWQDFHMDQKGWNDIAYQEAFDQQGNVYQLRGLRNRSAANGDGDVNATHGAFLLVLAPGEDLSDQMIASVRRRLVQHRGLYGADNRVLPHSALRRDGTECPGDKVRAAIERGVFAPQDIDPDPDEPKQTRVGAAREDLLELIDERLAVIPDNREQAEATLREARRLIASMPTS